MAVPAKKRLALDTNIAFDLAGNLAVAHDFREVCLERGYSFYLPPTAVEELAYFSTSNTGRESELATIALENLLSWKILPFQLEDVDRHLARRFSRLLRDRGLLPDEEGNDGRILGEVSAEGIPMLVTSDRHFLDMDAEQLRIAFTDSELPAVVAPVSPRLMLNALRGRQ
jgi:predicted nucleic acid-binding protein